MIHRLARCPDWVKRCRPIEPAAPPDVGCCSKTGHGFASQRNVAKCHVWTAPSWQELSSRLQPWSVQPCVRPLSAAHRAAGHNALRGSGPDQKHAFDHALAHVGCPDRRIDRLCITRCSPSQPSHHAGCPTRSRLCRKRDGFLITLASGHHRPSHPGNLVGQRDCSDLSRPTRQQCREPGSMLGAMDLGIADDGELSAARSQNPSCSWELIAGVGGSAEPCQSASLAGLR